MGKKDIITKNYIRRPEIFADIFNYRLYGGKDRIQPDQLKEMDIAESLVTNQKGNGGRFGKAVTVEKYRDIKKIFQEGCYRCLILGVEEQDKIHYAMPVRTFMYDAMAYHKQVDNIRKEHRKHKAEHIHHPIDCRFPISSQDQEGYKGNRRQNGENKAHDTGILAREHEERHSEAENGFRPCVQIELPRSGLFGK